MEKVQITRAEREVAESSGEGSKSNWPCQTNE